MTAAQEAAAVTSALATQASSATQGTCSSIDWVNGLVTVNIGGGFKTMPLTGDAPYVGDPVWVAFLGLQPIYLGPISRAAIGSIASAPTAGKVAVAADDGHTYTLSYNGGLSLAAGNRVAIHWPSRTVMYLIASEYVPPAVLVPPPVSVGVQTKEFIPVDSGSYNGAWTKPDVWCSDTYIGCYFYQGIADTIPDNAVIQPNGVTLSVVETANRFPGSLATFGTHTLAGKTGAPTITRSQTVSAGSGPKVLANAIGDALKTGAALGIGTNKGGFHQFDTATRGSGRLTISYTV